MRTQVSLHETLSNFTERRVALQVIKLRDGREVCPADNCQKGAN